MNLKRKEEKRKKTHIPLRMNLLFFAVFIMFSLLIVRLGVVQIVNGEKYVKEVNRTEDVIVKNGVPRGKIYDRYGNVMVDNISLNAITYTRAQSTKTTDMLEVAEKLAQLIEKDASEVTDRDKKDYWILKNPEKALEKVPKKERNKYLNDEELTQDEANSEIYQLQIKRITDKEINSLSKKDLEVLAIYREFSSGYALTPQIIKNKGVTQKEMAVVSENLYRLPGVNITTDWERSYVFGPTLRSILGNVSSAKEGLPKETAESYLAKDYTRNDRVGKSYVEFQYENVLQGHKEAIHNVTKNGSVLESLLVKEGQQGKDVLLTIDTKLQQEVEKIIQEEMSKVLGTYNSRFLDRAYVVVINPNTGELLTLAGKKYTSDGFQDDALGTFTSSYEVGSAAKGATVMTGYMTGVLTPGEYIVDEPLYIKDTPKKSSWFNVNGAQTGAISDAFALEKSSNSYMWKVAMRIAGTRYAPGQPLNVDSEDFTVIRNHFAQFGLGVKTGLDLPGESPGFQGPNNVGGKLLDLAIGQFDTYTPLQLAQYVSTIANDGYRIQPHILKEVRQPINERGKLGPISYEHTTKVLNRVSATENQINQVQQGFYQVYHRSNGTGYKEFHDAPYNAAGKTGTAEAYYNGTPTYNTSIIGYAPYDNPEVAFSVLVPWQHQNTDPYTNKEIARRVMDKYFELKKQRAAEGKNTSGVDFTVENADESLETQTEEN
jgi:cell division protein FtsI/penicillin-binding protein 2